MEQRGGVFSFFRPRGKFVYRLTLVGGGGGGVERTNLDVRALCKGEREGDNE